jgi:hypothetical protein
MTADVVAGYTYGLRDVKITSLAGDVQGDLPASQTLTWKEKVVSDELPGDDVIVSTVGFVQGIEWELEAGGISLEVYAMLTGETVSTTGSTPNRKQTITRKGGKNFPYIKIYGRALGDGNDGVQILIKKAKVTELEGSFKNKEFLITKCSGTGIGDANGDLYDLIKLETDAALPTT